MYRKIYTIVLLVLCVAVLGACTPNFNKVKVEDLRFNKIEMESISKMIINAELKVNNPTSSKIVIKSGEFDVSKDGMIFAHLKLAGETVIPSKSSEYQPLPMVLSITNMLALLSSGIDINNLEIEKLVINGSLKLKAGAWTKTFPVENTTLEQLEQLFKSL